jgi:tetratricopeptide (TPR) repeat protein
MKICPFLSIVFFEEKEGKKIPKVHEVSCLGEKCFFFTRDTCTFIDRTPFNLLSTKITSSFEKGLEDLRGEIISLKGSFEKPLKDYFEKTNEILEKFENMIVNYEKMMEEVKLLRDYEKIIFLFARGEYELAYEEVSKIEESKKDIRFKILEGILLFKKGEKERAKQIFEKLIEEGISSKEIYNNLGVIYYEEGNYDKAIETLEKGLKFSKDFPEILYHLGLAYYKKGEPEKAFEFFEKVLEIDPEFIEAKEALEKYKEGR